MTRREFFDCCKSGCVRWSPALGLLGFRLSTMPQAQTVYGVAMRGYVTWCGRFIAWVPVRPADVIRTLTRVL